MHNPAHWTERMTGLLVMQNVDNSIITYNKRGLFGKRMTTKPGAGQAPPAWIPEGNEVTRRVWPHRIVVPSGAAALGWCALLGGVRRC